MNQIDNGFDGQLQTRAALTSPRQPSRLALALRRRAPFLVVVVAPTILATFYYAAIATPQYISEAQFVVRGQNNQSSGALAGLMSITGSGGGSSEDTYAVQDYIMSRDAAREMLDKEHIDRVYSVPQADFLARFPNFYTLKSFEHFFSYYKRHVLAELDTTSGLSTLQVRTFTASDSQRIARALLNASERLVNKMNERQRQNLVASSLRERDDVVAHLRDLSKQIDAYRNQVAMLDPNKQSEPMLKDIATLQTMLITTQLQVEQLQATAPNSPLITVYQHRIAALADQIAHAATGVTGDDRSMVPKISAYDDLLLQRTLAEKELVTTTAALDSARAQADKQQLYLDEVTQPNLPDYPLYPRSLTNIAIVFLTMGALYVMASLIIAGAREHKIH
ncbi:hypothetical protein [Neoasaia chiangmaiensis]|nr:hypothetical protein [Neoasaia chiangmaiensis]